MKYLIIIPTQVMFMDDLTGLETRRVIFEVKIFFVLFMVMVMIYSCIFVTQITK